MARIGKLLQGGVPLIVLLILIACGQVQPGATFEETPLVDADVDADLVLQLTTATEQKALVYCPPNTDTSGCSNIASALGSTFLGGVDLGYDGSNKTVDLALVDLWKYAVFIVPSLANSSNQQPYFLLTQTGLSERLDKALMGRQVFWSGSPDLGDENRIEKDVLIRNLARWAAMNYDSVNGPGLVLLRDFSDDETSRYAWVKSIAGIDLASDPSQHTYSSVRTLTSTGASILDNGGTQLTYEDMASGGFNLPSGASGVTLDAVGNTGTNIGGQVVMVTAPGGNTGTAKVWTDKGDYAPGETVVIKGSGWESGETVLLALAQDPEVVEERLFTVTADEAGVFSFEDFSPTQNDVGVRFILTATGQLSGFQAQTTFTDANMYAFAEPEFSYLLRYYKVGNTTCSNPFTVYSRTIYGGPYGWGYANTYSWQSVRFTAAATSNQGTAFSHWVVRTYNPYSERIVSSQSVCIVGNASDTTYYYTAVYKKRPTTLSAAPSIGVSGGTTDLSATLTSNGVPVANKLINFYLNGKYVGGAYTDSAGVAQRSGASLFGVTPGEYPNGIQVRYSSTGLYSAAEATALLTVENGNTAPSAINDAFWHDPVSSLQLE